MLRWKRKDENNRRNESNTNVRQIEKGYSLAISTNFRLTLQSKKLLMAWRPRCSSKHLILDNFALSHLPRHAFIVHVTAWVNNVFSWIITSGTRPVQQSGIQLASVPSVPRTSSILLIFVQNFAQHHCLALASRPWA